MCDPPWWMWERERYLIVTIVGFYICSMQGSRSHPVVHLFRFGSGIVTSHSCYGSLGTERLKQSATEPATQPVKPCIPQSPRRTVDRRRGDQSNPEQHQPVKVGMDLWRFVESFFAANKEDATTRLVGLLSVDLFIPQCPNVRVSYNSPFSRLCAKRQILEERKASDVQSVYPCCAGASPRAATVCRVRR